MQTLLDKIGIIDYKYEKLREQNDFNIFSLLLNKHDEVNLHSNFIAELLDPEGSHKLGRKFLDHFLTLCGVEPTKLTQPEIFREFRNIDILIRSKELTIILENKIWAGDQDRQLDRYYNTIVKEGTANILIIYLSLDGKEPSGYSLGDLQINDNLDSLLLTLSYSADIRNWLGHCIKEAALTPSVRETIIQYKNLIEELTGNSMSREEMLELMALLGKNDNVLHAKKIVDNWIHVRWYTEWDFWNELEKKVEGEYTVLPNHKFSGDSLDVAIHRSRKRNLQYGLMFSVKKIGTHDICLYIERGDDNMYYGITILDENNNRAVSDLPIYNDLASKLKELSDWDREANWIAGNWFSEHINLEYFGEENTIKLVNPEYRRDYINKLWNEIKDYIKICELESFELPVGEPAA
ncbi:PD-(D/E)XK nuclease family protein [Pontibacter sp. KCTC 32443]|uniref:PDDEXK-like family protein n=1 Tax=Pontibacter TaxID=323449 RepID=UPI00164EA693|nr:MULTISPECIES: PD-(D/E)XK nuclease family protein [Pontibacter]MBC5772793.1 PD-(D/E)XK nuclease family protein [Pontibacter sp. KCTC 32443]